VVPRAAGQVLSDVSVDQPGATRLEIDESVADIRLSFAKGLHFRAVENESGLIFLKQMIIVGGGAILRHNLIFAFFGLVGLFGRLRH